MKFVKEYEGFEGIYDHEKEREIKIRYIKIIRAQLSTYELILLWYNSMQPFGQNFGKLMIEYELLDNVDTGAEIVLIDELRSQHPYID